MQQYKLELRDAWLALDTSALHGNSDRPGYYQSWVAVPDHMLPPRGISHRSTKLTAEESAQFRACELNEFVSSDLWKLQGFGKDQVPSAVAESDFHLPAAKFFLQSNDTRKNLTDTQETSQWMSGESLWTALLEASLGTPAFYEKSRFVTPMWKQKWK